jgi:phosphoglucosamine mutase
VTDCANGAAYKIAPKVFKDLGASVSSIGNEPDGVNINAGCGSTHPENLQKRVVEEGADIGLAFDGDADRLIAVDEKGRVVDGDKMIYICAKMLKDRGELKGNKVTATVMSNLGFHRAIESIGAALDVTQVGDRYVLEKMLETGCVIGGEQSGHIIFLDHNTTGDGILSALQLLKALKLSGKKLSELADEVAIYPQVLKNAPVKNEFKKKYKTDTEIIKEIDRIEDLMAHEGRVLIRPSGTEPLVRVMIEGKNQAVITELAEDLAKLITRKYG